jgi:ubiquinone/menaquinone biosynthesis C-methylase UbiE
VRRPEFVARQSACPSGLLGRLISRVMALETAAVNEAAVALLELRPIDHLLEVGFGHGATIARAAAAVSGGFVAGVDPSDEAHRMATRLNRRAIEAGRVELRRGTAQRLPFRDEAFDKVLSVHTVYFWPDLGPPLREIARVLKPGGSLVLVHRTDAAGARTFPSSVYRFASEAEVGDAMAHAGLVARDVTRREFGKATISFQVARG